MRDSHGVAGLRAYPTNDDGESEHEQAEVRGIFFLEANKQLAEAIDEGVSDLDNPPLGCEIRIALEFFLFLAAGTDVRGKAALFYLLLRTDEPCIKAEVLRMLLRRQRTENHNAVKGFRQQFDVVNVRACRYNRNG